MKILFTGSNGFLGRNTIQSLQKKGYNIITLNQKSGNYQADISFEIPKFYENFEYVVHAAGKAHIIPKTEEEINSFYRINYEGTKNLCKSLENFLPKHFVFISTVAVYGKEFGSNITEDEPLIGKTPYANSKKMAEDFLQNWCKAKNVKLTILRPSLIAGPNPPGNLGAMEKAIKKGTYFNISGGNVKKSMVWVEDFADIIDLTIKGNGGIYNVCDTESPTFAQISKKISLRESKKPPKNIPFFVAKIMATIGDLFGPKSPINSLKLKKMTEDLTFSNSKIINELGWKPTNVLEKL